MWASLNIGSVKRQPAKRTARVAFRCGCRLLVKTTSGEQLDMAFCGKMVTCPSSRWIAAEVQEAKAREHAARKAARR